MAVVQYTIRHKQYTEQHNQQLWLEGFLGFELRVVILIGKCGSCPVFASYTLAFALTAEEKAWKNLSQGSRRVPVGKMKIEYTEQNIHNNKNT